MHLKTFIKIAVFCVSMLILKMVGKSNIFGILCFIISTKVKMQLKHTQKRCVQCMGKGRYCNWSNVSKVVCEVFHAETFSFNKAPQLGRSVEVDSNQIETLTENKQHYTMQEIANKLKTVKSSTENHLHQPSYVYCFDVWIPHKLSNKNLFNHIFTCGSPLKHNENIPLVKQIVTGNEKWIFYK